MSVDEVAFGLALQSMTPFRFSCNRLLMRRLPELQLPVFNLIRLLDPLVIRHRMLPVASSHVLSVRALR